MRRPCLTECCPHYAETGRSYCSACQGERRWQAGLTGARGSRGDWKRRRAVVLTRDRDCCQDCGDPATVVHHVDGDATNDALPNLVSLCVPCHLARHRDKPPHNAASILGRLPPHP
jgi:5-methylcytosine-specific restriction endonuclease McrA